MRKLKLNAEDLAVASFETQADGEPREGTVQAFGNIPVPHTQQQTCGPTYCFEQTCFCVDLSARTLCGLDFTAYCSNACTDGTCVE
jgi:hypothetical protein